MKKRKAPFPWGIGLAKLGPRKYLFDANLAVNLDFIEQQGFDLVEAVDETSQTVVWKAVQRTLERTVILRILKPEAASDPAAVAHFLNIARIVSRIKSESLAAIFDIVSNKGLYYIVMEHVNGPTLEEEVSADGPLPLERILRIAASLIVSLDQLWGASYIVHRNLKSSTIRTSRRGVSKITDFSLAIQASPGVNATAMDEGNIVGTPCFLSPEQAQGSHTLTTQSDMYALGIVLYHLSTGTVPFENEDVVSILAAHVKRQIPPPHHLNPALSPSFSWLLHRLMMKHPGNRYPDWKSVLQDIRLLLAGSQPSCAHPNDGFLSTIETFEDNAPSAPTDQEDEPQFRFKPVRRANRRLATYRSQNIEEEHASDIRRETLIKESLCWLALLLWLATIFWFRAVRQAPPQSEGNTRSSQPLAQAPAVPSQAASNPADSSDAASTGQPREVETPAADPTEQVASATPSPAPIPKDPAPAPADTPAPAPASPEPAKATVLPSGIPDALAARLADALAAGSPAAALRVLQADPARFQEKARLAEFLGGVPEVDDLVTEFLRTRIGRPLILEHNGKQRTVIPRSVRDGVIGVETNGRGIDIAISDLTADEKLRWIERPKDTARIAAYCLVLMHSSRRGEVSAYATACPPFVAPLITEAAKRAAATARP
ncbi:MAG: serine/threonine-protein kinase [Kiritimatiellae bacterium]|jgi:serine/threonine protein kinase|nr:serine/threonine-protein kinase [Kiritimatiellia bacterium]HHU14103.1 serine/threonine protein kinase [Lentisphaerota bacterium]